MSSILDGIAGLPPWLLLAMVFLLPAAEAGILIGVFVPGETAVILGGVAASQGRLELWEVITAAILGAVLGDQAGFLLGRRFGPSLVDKVPERLWRPENIERSLEVIRRRGPVAVILGRWTAALRAFVPGIAGMSGMTHRTFTWANIVGGATWASVVSVGGYLAGDAYKQLEATFGTAGKILTVVVVVAIVVFVAYRHFRPSAPAAAPAETGDDDDEPSVADRG